jgi:hypothetical protein
MGLRSGTSIRGEAVRADIVHCDGSPIGRADHFVSGSYSVSHRGLQRGIARLEQEVAMMKKDATGL